MNHAVAPAVSVAVALPVRVRVAAFHVGTSRPVVPFGSAEQDGPPGDTAEQEL